MLQVSPAHEGDEEVETPGHRAPRLDACTSPAKRRTSSSGCSPATCTAPPCPGRLTRPVIAAARALAHAARATDPPVGWRLVEGPYFDNHVGTLVPDGRRATVALDKTVADDGAPDGARLERVCAP